MNPFSYLSALTSIVVALGMARVLTGTGKILQARGQMHIYWVHLVWTLNVFIYLVLIWWILYRWQVQAQWNFFLVLFLLLSPTIAFLESVLLFPDVFPDNLDFRQHFYNNRRWFFLLAALLPPLDVLDTYLKGWDHLVAQGIIYPIAMTIIFALSLVAAFTRRETYHKFYAIFFLIFLSAFISINLRTLN